MMLFSGNPKELGKALGFWGASAAAGGSAGVFLGGVITEWLSSQWTFLINVPVGILALILSPGLLAKGTRRKGSIDIAGSISVTASLVLIVYGIVTAEHNEWGTNHRMDPYCWGDIVYSFPHHSDKQKRTAGSAWNL